MGDVTTLLTALAAIAAICVAAWTASLALRNVSVVDSLWSLFFLLAAFVYAGSPAALGAYEIVVLLLVAVWSLRLSIHIASRNFGEPEDRRYRAIRANNEPHFAVKSLFIVFLLQGLLAWVVSVPLLYAFDAPAGVGPWHGIAVLLWSVGFLFEAGGDWQLQRFRARRGASQQVLDTGLWRYTRHPNYFGDACIWWSYWLLAAANGAWWTIFSPLLMTFLLLRVSGVAMLERTIGARRPGYADYVRRTSAFIPLPPRARRNVDGGNTA